MGSKGIPRHHVPGPDGLVARSRQKGYLIDNGHIVDGPSVSIERSQTGSSGDAPEPGCFVFGTAYQDQTRRDTLNRKESGGMAIEDL